MGEGSTDVTLRVAGDQPSKDTARPDASSMEPSAEERMSVPERVGRYVVLRELGAGAMGMVVVAYDPELDRQIAIKLIHPKVAGSREAHARMLREAKGLARLSHPNVVQVYDAGTLAGRVFIAMELVDGEPLSRWGEVREREVAEVLAVYLGAGLGLAAAHDAGLVHRDFKPDNVLVDRGGRARVLDFGLVRALGEAEPRAEGSIGMEPTVEVELTGLDLLIAGGPREESSGGLAQTHATKLQPRARESSGAFGSHNSSELELELTHGGQLMGTPAYMSPEQWRGAKTDARSDQFSFCVTLWEALYGQRPFAGRTIQALARAVCAGDISEPESPTRLPRRVRAALERGLQVDPARRFATMHELILELGREDWSRRSLPLAALALGAFGLLAWGSPRGGVEVEAPPSCAAAGAGIDAIWTPARSEQIRARFTAIGSSNELILAQIGSGLDDYTRRWRGAAEDNCAATKIREQQSMELLELRARCLDTKLDALDALLEVFAEADAAIVDEALFAVESLPSVLGCEAQRVRSSTAALPDDPQEAMQVGEARRELARARAYLDTGHFGDAGARLDALAGSVAALDYAPLAAEFAVEQGRLHARLDRYELAGETLRAGYLGATRLRDDELALRAALWLAELEGARRQRPEFGALWAELAHVLLDRDPVGSPDIAAGLADTVSWNAYLAGDLELAREEAQRGLSGLDEAGLEAPSHRLALLLDRGAAEYGAGALAEAQASFSAALELAEATFGRDNAKATGALNNLAVVYSAAGEFEQARELLRESVQTRERALGPDNATVGVGLSNLADVELELGEGAAALASAARAHTILMATVGPDQYATVIARQRLGLARGMTGDPLAGVADLRAALEAARTPPPDESLAFELGVEIAVLLAAAGDAPGSEAQLERLRGDPEPGWRELVIAGRYAGRIAQPALAISLLELGLARRGEPEAEGMHRTLATAKLSLAELLLAGEDASIHAPRAIALLDDTLDADLHGAPKLLARLAASRSRARSLSE